MDHQEINPLIKVWIPALGSMVLTLANVQVLFAIGACCISAGYTLWKWRVEYLKRKRQVAAELNKTIP